MPRRPAPRARRAAPLLALLLATAAPAQEAPAPALPAEGVVDASVAAPAAIGRHGPLSDRERAMAEAAWSYFEGATQAETGLANSVGSYPSTTMWDTASYIGGLVAARELGLIDKRAFDDRALRLLATLRNMPLFRGETPNKVYDTRTATMVNYANEPGEVGTSALDIGRLLVWLAILAERYPYLANSVDAVPLRWTFCGLVAEDGRLFGSHLGSDGEIMRGQEGRLGYEEYAAKGFALWGFDVPGALDPEPYDTIDIHGVEVPFDGRDPRTFRTQTYVLTESYLLDGLEMGWDLAWGDDGGPGVATDGWRAEFGHRVFLAQKRRYEETGLLTARSEHQVEGAPYFVYDAVYADGYAWSTLDPDGGEQPDRAAIAAKAAIGMWALWDDPYTDLLFDAVADLSEPEGGFWEGLYENGNGAIPLQTANNNGIILAALLYKAQGPILQRGAPRPRYWATAYAETDLRDQRCLPVAEPEPAACCDCAAAAAAAAPPVAAADFTLCRAVETATGIAAEACLGAVPEADGGGEAARVAAALGVDPAAPAQACKPVEG